MPSCFRFLVKWSRFSLLLSVPKLILLCPLFVIIRLNKKPFYVRQRLTGLLCSDLRLSGLWSVKSLVGKLVAWNGGQGMRTEF